MDNIIASWNRELRLVDIQRELGSPLWIVSKRQLIDNLSVFCRFTSAAANVLFPVKANPAPCVLSILAAAGAGADCANEQEVDTALLCGFPYARIVYNSPLQDVPLCIRILQNGGTVVLDDPLAMQAIDMELEKGPLPGRLWMRINPLVTGSYENRDENQDLMAHGHSSSKFGVPEEDIEQLLKQFSLHFQGLHLHVGTQMDTLETFVLAMASLHRVARQLSAQGHPIQSLDLGGGLGIAFTPGQKFPSAEDWADRLAREKSADYQYFVEPGHALAGNAVALLTTVGTIKHSRGKSWAVCDVGTDQLAKVTLLRWPHVILDKRGHELPLSGRDALAGPLCFAGDTLLQETSLAGVEVGDPLLVTNAGAYTFALSNNFNGRTIPAWAVFEEGQCRLVSMAEGLSERLMLQHQRWGASAENSSSEFLSPDLISKLKSDYLTDQVNQERFEYEKFERIGPNCYEVMAMIHSPVSFVSMPLAIRLIGDATIIAVLRSLDVESKSVPVWGKKLTMEYFGKVPSGKPFCFRLFLSSLAADHENKSRIVVSFEANNCSLRGSILVNF
ncbi:MAG: hypothetical protein RI973_1600 [Bacteroidota bacterium]|jgi:diaminopimelate decarboxylase